jgi:hypothetical protein
MICVLTIFDLFPVLDIFIQEPKTMEEKTLVRDDYRKWLLYSMNSTEPEKLYHLFKAIESSSSSGDVLCEKNTSGDKVLFSISCGSVADGLVVDENGLKEFKTYLKKNYIGEEDVDRWYKEKVQHEARVKNYNRFGDTPQSGDGELRVTPHPREIFYFNLRLVIAVGVYIAVLGFGYISYLAGTIAQFILTAVLLVLLSAFVLMMLKGLFVGMIRGNSVRITVDQYPEIFAIVKELGGKMGVK